MQNFPNIPPETTLTGSRQLLLDRDSTLLSCFSGEQFPSTDLAEGMLCYRSDSQQLYQLKSLDGPSWQMIANLNETITSQEAVNAMEESLADDIGSTHDVLTQTITTLEDETINQFTQHQKQINDNDVELAGLDQRCEVLDDTIKTQEVALKTYTDAAVQNIEMPTGSIMMYGSASLPAGWLSCSGAAISRVKYDKLFAVIDTQYGTGNGSTTFHLPDLRGRMPMGIGQGTGLTNRTLNQQVGTEIHTLTTAEMAHTHALAVIRERRMQYDTNWGKDFVQTDITGPINANTAAAHNNMPPALGLVFMIKV